MPLLENTWSELKSAAESALDTIKQSGWESLFGALEEKKSDPTAHLTRLMAVANDVKQPTKPWVK